MAWGGIECPCEDCGSVLTHATLSSRDNQGRPIRKRRCANCGTVFVTVEDVVRGKDQRLVKFSEVDDMHQERINRRLRERYGWQRKKGTRRPKTITGTMVVLP